MRSYKHNHKSIGPRQGVRWSVSHKFEIYVHLFGQSQSTKHKENARYIEK